ncbi:MAG TPA: hypothetical protein VIX20_07715, partial [Ktedonobacteraceae bacterium]
MQTNSYEDDTPLAWIPQQNRLNEARYAPARPSHQPASLQYQEWQQRVQDQKPKPQERMPKVRALELVNVYKKRLIVASLVVFGLLSGLVAFHQVGAAANQGQVDPSQSAPVTQPSNGGFFDQQGGNNFGSSGPWQQPASRSGVS